MKMALSILYEYIYYIIYKINKYNEQAWAASSKKSKTLKIHNSQFTNLLKKSFKFF